MRVIEGGQVERTPRLPLRLVTFNVHFGADVAALAHTLATDPMLRDADVILLQEIRSYPKEGSCRACKLGDGLGMRYVYAPAYLTRDGGTHGLALLSRWPLSDVQVLPLARHELPVRHEQRIALGVTVALPDGLLRIYDVHLDVRINLSDRIAQLQPVLEAARSFDRVVIAGDFNTNDFCWKLGLVPIWGCPQARKLDGFMREAGFATPLAKSGPTERAFGTERIDGFYLRGVRARGGAVDRAVTLSDHLPVWLELQASIAPGR